MKKKIHNKEANVKEKVSWLIISKLYFYRKNQTKNRKKTKHRKRKKSNHKMVKIEKIFENWRKKTKPIYYLHW